MMRWGRESETMGRSPTENDYWKKRSASALTTLSRGTHIDLNLISLLLCLLLPVLPLQDCSTVLVQLDVDDDNIRGVYANGHRGAVGLVALDTVDMDDPFFAVDLCYFALAALVFSANDSDFVVLADGEGAGLRDGVIQCKR